MTNVNLLFCCQNNTPGFRHLSKSLTQNTNMNPFLGLARIINEKSANGTKFNTYVSELNIMLALHPIYTTETFIPDSLRKSFSRIRLMSHNLKVETGRWSRIPRESRLCHCNDNKIQTESHVLVECSLTHNVRLRYPALNFTDISSLFNESTHLYSLCNYVNEILRFYS